jgi:transposase-like protein
MRTYVRMAHARYLRRMARSLRVEQRLTVDQLAARLSLPRSTIYYWVRDLPLREAAPERTGEPSVVARDVAEKAPRKPARARSEAAYEEGLATFEELSAQPTFRDFICIYLVQGEQRDRTRVSLSNSDPAVMRLACRWLRRLSGGAPFLLLRYGPDQSPRELRRFWGETIGIAPRSIRVRGSCENLPSGQPAARLTHGLLTIGVDDALLRARLQGWMRRARESWL